MAKVRVKTIPPVPVEPVKVVHVELSLDEAEMIASLLGECSSWGETDKIYREFCRAGVDGFKYTVNGTKSALELVRND